jgi:hypothetical protein
MSRRLRLGLSREHYRRQCSRSCLPLYVVYVFNLNFNVHAKSWGRTRNGRNEQGPQFATVRDAK